MTRDTHDFPALRKLDVAHHLPAQRNYQVMRAEGGSRIIVRGEGSTLYDGEGKALLDGMAGLWCVQVGYGRKELATAAYDQMCALAYYNTFFKTAAAPTILLSAKLAELLGGNLRHVFFNNSGSEAIDTVIRLARYYWQIEGQPKRSIFISRTNSYHGSTIAGVSLGGMKHMHDQGGPWVPNIVHIMQPYAFGESQGEDPASFGKRAARALEEKIVELGAENIAGFIGEPVQGAGGVIIPPESYWPRIEAICRKYGILLVCDEVICGFGRLGRWFGFQHFGVKPDLVSMAKGLSSGYLPISAVGVADFIVEALRRKGGDFFHGYTYSGHPTAAAVALKNIAIIEDERLVERTANDTGPYLAQSLATLADHPLVGEVRALGLIGAVEIVANKATCARFGTQIGQAGAVVRDLCIAHGVMVRAVRDTIVMSPPLIISHTEIDRLVGTIGRALDLAAPQLHALAVGAQGASGR